ncbi:MAG: hypothetical protein JW908_03455 [Anaerolineales bacterium]|nr:hypothetical protein [Anaerolineales bacterium]
MNHMKWLYCINGITLLIVFIVGCTAPVTPATPPTPTLSSLPHTTTPTIIPPAFTHTPTLPIIVAIDGATLTLEKPPIVEDGVVFIPWRNVFTGLGYITYIYTDLDEPYIGGTKNRNDGNITNFHLQLNTKELLVDPGQASSKTITLSAYPKVENGEVMIPLNVLSASLGASVIYHDKTGYIDIDTGRNVESLNLQKSSPFNANVFLRKTSDQLTDNRITSLASGLSMIDFNQEGEEENSHLNLTEIIDCGITRVNLTINNQDWEPENWDISEFEIDPRYRPLYERIKQAGIKRLTYNLIFKDKDFLRNGGTLGYPRFKDEAEIQRYLDYVRTTVRYFKGVVDTYEIWNEQNIEGSGQYIEPEDYIEVVKRVVPVIREEDPAAKISVGQTTQFDDPASREYIYKIIESDLMPLVDAIALHTAFWDSPEHESEYYYAYPEHLQKVKETAWAHGFKGEFIGGEGNFAPGSHIPEDMKGRVPEYSMIKAGKYAARINVMSLGLGFSGGSFAIGGGDGPAYNMLCNTSTIFAGAEPQEVEVKIQSRAEKIRDYSFFLPNGDTLIALWVDDVAEDEDAGEAGIIKIIDYSNHTATAIDILNNTEQEIIYSVEGNDMVIENLLIKDYPIILRLKPS